MTLAIMQPYFFPYIGYWQLIHAVDMHVIYDDVNYIKGGWINRNYILLNGGAKLINLQLRNASPNKLIFETELMCDELYNRKLLKTIEQAYKKALYFNDVFPLIEGIILQNEKSLSKYLAGLITRVCGYLGINTRLVLSSETEKDNSLKGQDKVLEICGILGANRYINAIGGMELYSKGAFEKHNIELSFIKTREIKYKQYNNEFVPNLSIIDVMMFNSKEEIKRMLNEYDLV